MASLYGADLGQLNALGSTFGAKAEEVGLLRDAINGQVSSSDSIWTGPGANNFRTAWNQEFFPAMNALQTALFEAQKAINAYHQNIEAATA